MWSRAGMRHSVAIAFCAALAIAVDVLGAQQPNIDFTVSGTSTVRSWSCSAKGVTAVTPGTAAQPVPGFPRGVQSATVTVPITAFTCPNEEMTGHLREAMKADKFPDVVFRLERYEVTGGQAQATGTMTITGVTQPLTFPVTLSPSGQGVQVEGNTRLEFAKFGLEPPTVMLGLLKVGPQIRIQFKGLVTP
jgi:polyisoprenoid-binding protein YceI